jgi:hypothetical protein
VSASERDDSTESLLHRYEALHEHAELELGLAGKGEVEQLAELGERWDQLTAELPPRPPLAAAALLQRARLIHERTHVELERMRGTLLDELAATKRARRVADGYAGQLAPRPRLDRSA